MSEELETSQVLMPANWKGSLSLNKQAFTASNIKLGGTTYMCKNQKENFVIVIVIEFRRVVVWLSSN